MEKLLVYIALTVLLILWVSIYAAVPAMQGLMVIISICGVVIGSRCKKTQEGH